MAGGIELAVWCDLRVAGDSARFGCLERRWGVPLIDGGTYRLPRIVGLGRALDLILTGREFDVTEAEAHRFRQPGGAAGHALDAAVELAEALASVPWRALVNDRRSVYEGLGLGLDDGARQRGRAGAGHDLRRGLRRRRGRVRTAAPARLNPDASTPPTTSGSCRHAAG